MDAQAIAFLKKETVRLQGSAKRRLRIGLAIAAIIAIYLTYIASQYVALALNPQVLASVASNQLDHAAPELIAGVEQELIQDAPEIASNVYRTLTSMVPTAGETARTQLDYFAENIPGMFGLADPIIDTFFEINGDRIQRVFASANNPQVDEDALIQDFTDNMFDHIAAEMRRDLQLSHEGEHYAGPSEISLFMIKTLTSRMQELSRLGRRNMTPRERLERRLIVAWAVLLTDQVGISLTSEW